MISIAALLLTAATSQTQPDAIFNDAFDAGASCPASISSPNGPLGLRQVSDIWYYPNGIRHSVDVRDFDNIWGHISALDGLTDWPGVGGASPTIKTIGRYEYVAARFHVPFTAPPTLWGTFKHVMYSGGPRIDVSISRTCGDFAPSEPYCLATNVVNDDSSFMRWRVSTQAWQSCTLEPDADYFVNIRFTDPTATGPDCSGLTCQTTIQQYIGGL